MGYVQFLLAQPCHRFHYRMFSPSGLDPVTKLNLYPLDLEVGFFKAFSSRYFRLLCSSDYATHYEITDSSMSTIISKNIMNVDRFDCKCNQRRHKTTTDHVVELRESDFYLPNCLNSLREYHFAYNRNCL